MGVFGILCLGKCGLVCCLLRFIDGGFGCLLFGGVDDGVDFVRCFYCIGVVVDYFVCVLLYWY